MRSLKSLIGSGLLLTVTALLISVGCKKQQPPQDRIKAFFTAVKTCNKPEMRRVFTPKLLAKLQGVFKASSQLVGMKPKFSMLDAWCHAFKNAKLRIISVKNQGDTAEVTVDANKQRSNFLLRLEHGQWLVYALESPVWRISEQGVKMIR